MMFLEKHWLTLLLLAVLICMAANARAEIVSNQYIERTQYMYDRAQNGPGVPDVQRIYDSETGVVCYKFSDSTGNYSCVPCCSKALREKYNVYHAEAMERRAKEAGLK
uniref:Uncharacterized protein n=1 Tax=Pseudomonas phage HRDY3 TaxID=3236930 RepID=A0AB39CD80_9VIRU